MASTQVCASCSDNFIVNNKQIECNFCKNSYHLMCVRVKENIKKATSDCANVLWFCSDCIQVVQNNLNILSKVQKIEQRTKEILEKTSRCLDAIESAGASSVNVNRKWSDVVKTNKNPPLIIKPKNNSQNSNITKKVVIEKINPADNAIAVKKVNTGGQGSIRIECKDTDSLNKLKDIATSTFADEYDVEIPEMRKPKMIIVGVHEKHLVNCEDLMRKIKNNVHNVADIDVKFIKKFIPQKKTLHNVIIEMSLKAFDYFIREKRIFLDWESYPMYEFVSVVRCFKCWKYGHMANVCKQDNVVCSKCSGHHRVEDCTNTETVCSNCKYVCEVLKIPNIKYDHSVFAKNCPTYKREIEKCKKRTSYT